MKEIGSEIQISSTEPPSFLPRQSLEFTAINDCFNLFRPITIQFNTSVFSLSLDLNKM